MIQKTYRTYVELQNGIINACKIAVEQTAQIIMEKLKEIIKDEYYDKYEPERYYRTYEFLNSATYKMLKGMPTAMIGIDDAYFDYEYPVIKDNDEIENNDNDEVWTGETQVNMANEGYHGSPYIRRDGRFYDEFIRWCDANAINLLKENLRKQGINV